MAWQVALKYLLEKQDYVRFTKTRMGFFPFKQSIQASPILGRRRVGDDKVRKNADGIFCVAIVCVQNEKSLAYKKTKSLTNKNNMLFLGVSEIYYSLWHMQ